ncbi:MAG: DNA-binding response OmpR family regulator [Thermoproteota archaeon]|jgi:DNA-binding response OmpR family regulator
MKILAADDNEVLRKLLFLTLDKDFDVILAKNGEEAIELWTTEKPDLVILDIMLPDYSGFEICSKMKADHRYVDTPVIFLSAKTGPDARTMGYQLGAVNYLEKPFHPTELLAIIKSTLVYLEQSTSELIQYGPLSIDLIKNEARIDKIKVDLTQTEFQLLVALSRRKGMILSREYLLDQIGSDLDKKERVIDSHLSHLRKKLKNTPLRIKSIYKQGYKLFLDAT